MDKKAIGLTAESQAIVDDIDARGWFPDKQDIARFAMSFAIRAGVGPGTAQKVETRWASGNFDPDGEIRAVVKGLYPECEEPVILMEHFVNEGLRLMHRAILAGGGPAELVQGG